MRCEVNEQFPIAIEAVSYTHLDVYKRQPLDRTSIHPESYALAKKILAQFALTPSMMGSEEARASLEKVTSSALARCV